MPLSRMLPRASSGCSPGVCVAAVLGDALRRVAVLGGREGMPRSLGSVYGGSVTRFLGGSCRGVVSYVTDMTGVKSFNNGVAVSRDGATLLVSDWNGGSDAIHTFRVDDGSRLRVIGSRGDGPLQLKNPRQVWVASDGFVFVADNGNDRVQVLTPRLTSTASLVWVSSSLPRAYAPMMLSSWCQRQAPTASACSSGVTALCFVASGVSAMATASCTARTDCASCPGGVTSQSLTATTVA